MEAGILGGGNALGWLAVILFGLPTLAISQESGSPRGVSDSMPVQVYRPMGAGSCSARACHGSTEQDFTFQDLYRRSHTTWIQADKHSRATQVLHNDRSKAITTRLNFTEPAYQSVRCLACHATPEIAPDPGPYLFRFGSDGVSCESCHGPASGWLEPHVSQSWKSKSPKEKSTDYGMNPLGTLAERAENCVGCHTGAAAGGGLPLRDMNHEMIAAGHPRLTFEFAAYLEQMPKHWIEKAPSKDYRAQSWLIGQLATAKATCELTASRAKRNRQEPPTASWPEFSEYNCYSCHFQLKPALTWRAAGKNRDEVGLPEWGSWMTPRLRDLSLSVLKRTDSHIQRELDELAKAMRLDNTSPAAAEIKAEQLAKQFGDWIRKLEDEKPDPGALLDFLEAERHDTQRWKLAHWDDATQLFLALSALSQPDSPRPGGSLQRRNLRPKLDIDSLRQLLMFPTGKESPGDFNPSLFQRSLDRK